jgi:hypothetical protein
MSEPVTDVRRELEQFVEFLIDTGTDSLQSKIPDREDLQRAVARLGGSVGEVIHAIEQSESGEAHEHALRCLWSVLGDAFIIGSRGTLSDNSEAVARRWQAEKARVARSRQRQQDPTIRILAEVVDRLRRPGDEAHPHKMADAWLSEANQVLEAEGLRPVKRDRLANFIRGHFARS